LFKVISENYLITEAALVVFMISGIVAIVRRRGGNAVHWGAVACVGYIVLRGLIIALGLFKGPAYEEGPINFGRVGIQGIWLAGVALAARFILGRGQGAGGPWFCPDCNTLNTSDASHCEACGRAYTGPTDSPVGGK
jgi:hypothetical protein